jgi:hypothetical protein
MSMNARCNHVWEKPDYKVHSPVLRVEFDMACPVSPIEHIRRVSGQAIRSRQPPYILRRRPWVVR